MTIIAWLRNLAVLACVLLQACTMAPKYDKNHPIGTLGVVGSNVTLNGKPGPHGALIHVGDRVATGPGSSAMIVFTDGGYFQLDQNTDPLFVIERLQSGFCILAHMLVGQVFVDKRTFCLQTPDIQAINNSEINVQVNAGQTLLTVARGKVTLLRPTGAPVLTGQQLMASRQRKAATVRSIDSRELATLLRWRENYKFQGWCCRDGKLSQSDRKACSSAGSFSFNKGALQKICGAATPSVDFREIFKQQRPTRKPSSDSPPTERTVPTYSR